MMLQQERRCSHCGETLPDRYKGREAKYCRPPKNCKEEARKLRKSQAQNKTESLFGTLENLVTNGPILARTN